MAESSPAASNPLGRILDLFGVVLYLLTGVLPYAASGLVVPMLGILILYIGWGVGLALAIRLLRRRSGFALLMPLAALGYWWLVVSIGEALFGWTA